MMKRLSRNQMRSARGGTNVMDPPAADFFSDLKEARTKIQDFRPETNLSSKLVVESLGRRSTEGRIAQG